MNGHWLVIIPAAVIGLAAWGVLAWAEIRAVRRERAAAEASRRWRQH